MAHYAGPPLITYPTWQSEYLTAVTELDPEKLLACITIAERAVAARMSALQAQGGNPVEVQALRDAISGLQFLKRDTKSETF